MKTQPNIAARFARISVLIAVCLGCLRAHAADVVDISKLPPPAKVQVDFARDIKPILEESCLRCHGPEKPRSHFRLDNRESALKGGEDGIDILPGNSAKSPLIHNVAYLVEDTKMPPPDKGKQLTTNQVALLRAWIDQGAQWDTGRPAYSLDLSLSPTFGWSIVHGDEHKFREHYWQKEGPNGGLEQFEMFEQSGPNTRTLLTGHALLNDYKIELSVDHTDLGFIHTGWENYRKYYDDTGGYFPALADPAQSLGEDLHLDIGKAWIDFGLTLPNWPRMTLGYEYDYRQGNEATLEWGAVGTAVSPNPRNIAPASEAINEGVHILKFNLDDEIKGVSIEERFRGEFYDLDISHTNTMFPQEPESVAESTRYFQGANTLRLERKFTDWFYASAGYLFSKMDADSSFYMNTPTLFQVVEEPRITLDRIANVGNVNGILGPYGGFTLSGGGQVEWSRQTGFGEGTFDQESAPPPPISNMIVPYIVSSEYAETSYKENLTLRYSDIPYTSVFAETRLEQRTIGQDDQFAASEDILNKAVFTQHTAYSSQSSDTRIGFNTSPWTFAALSAHYRRFDEDNHYNSDPLIQPIQTGYPTFLRSLEPHTDEAEVKLALNPLPRLKETLTYRYQSTQYEVSTAPYSTFGIVISDGGDLVSANQHSHDVSINTTLTATARLFLSTTFSYEFSRTVTESTASPEVAPYIGNVYSALANCRYVLGKDTELFANGLFSEADYAQNNFASGLPLGIEYQRYTGQFGLTHRFGKKISTKLQYRFDDYNEPTSGGAANYRAHTIFGTVTFRLP